MLITREPTAQKKIQFRIRISVKIYDQIMQYCQWACINKREFFIEEACKYILFNDKEWITYTQNNKFINDGPLPINDVAVMPLQDNTNK